MVSKDLPRHKIVYSPLCLFFITLFATLQHTTPEVIHRSVYLSWTQVAREQCLSCKRSPD